MTHTDGIPGPGLKQAQKNHRFMYALQPEVQILYITM